MGEYVECIECAAQYRIADTDAGHCPDCGGECMDLDQIYGPGGLYAEDDAAPPPAQKEPTP